VVGFFISSKINYITLIQYPWEGQVAGCDEAGRGCLAGPVSAAAVILPKGFDHPLLNDSKKLSHKTRELLRPIIEKEALAWSVQYLSPKEIDQHNILRASLMAMHRCLEKLDLDPDLILVDGNHFFPYRDTQHLCVIKGDGKYKCIAAASVLAKTHRDEYMLRLSNKHQGYGWETNMGYPTKAHRAAIKELGVTKHHRLTFRMG